MPAPRRQATRSRSKVGRVDRAMFGLLLAVGLTASWDSLRIEPIGGIADGFLVAAGGLLLARVVAGRARMRAGPYIRLVLATGLFAVGGLIGTAVSEDATSSLLNLARFTMATCGLAVLFAALDPRPAAVRRLAGAYVLGCSISSSLSMVTLNPATGRASGLASHPNVLALSAAFAFALVLGLLATTHGPARWWARAAAAVLLVGISNSGSRAGLVAVLVAIVVYLALTRQARALLAAGVVSSALAISLATGAWEPPPESAVGRVLFAAESSRLSDEGRVELAGSVLDRISENVVTGSGFAQATQAHNIYLQIIDTAGLLGVLAFSAMVVAILRRSLRRHRDPMVAGGIAMFTGYLAAGLAANTMWDRWLWFPIMVLVAAAANRPGPQSNGPEPSAVQPVSPAPRRVPAGHQ